MTLPVHISRLHKSFGPTTVLQDVSLSVQPGEFVSLLGPSGCGKSTLLRIVAGLEQQDRGDIHIGERRVNAVAARDRNVAMVFQNYALYPHMTVRDNIAMPLIMSRLGLVARQPMIARWWPGNQNTLRDIDQQVRLVSDSLQLSALLDRKPGQLSGGQRQRVALARAMVRNPSIFLMDEPLSNLDAKLRVEVRDELADLHHRLGASFLYVTHDQNEALTLSHRVAVMEAGRILQIDTPQRLYEAPANLAVARFIGSPMINTWEVSTDALGRFQDFSGQHQSTLDQPRQLTLGLRPEHIQVSHDGDFEHPVQVRTQAVVRRCENQGAEWILQLNSDSTEATPLQVRIHHRRLDHVPRHGDQITLGWRLCDVLMFGGHGVLLDEQLLPSARWAA
jgi:multiple sugar transport system ATP-binding protein